MEDEWGNPDDTYWGDDVTPPDGGVIIDDGGTPIDDGSGGDGGGVAVDNGDGSYSDEFGDIYNSATGQWLGWESALGDGTWFNPDGQMFDANNNWVRDEYLVHDEQSDTWYDAITGEWYNGQGELTDLHPRDPPDGVTDIPGTVTDLPNDNGGGIFDSIGNALKKLLGGSGSDSALGNAAASRASQAQQAMQKAQQTGTATAAQLAALQRQLTAAQAAAAQYGGSGGNTILIASVVGLGVYALTRPRD